MTKSKKLSQAEVKRRLNDEWFAMLQEIGLNPDKDALTKLANTKDVRPELFVVGGTRITLGMLLQDFGKAMSKVAKIDNDQQLQDAVGLIRGAREKIPTVIRKAMKEIRSTLPRQGGPGRQPKLTAIEANQMCDQIAMYIRQNNKLKEALQKVSRLTPQLLGKNVSPRTLQKAWDRRGQQN